MMRKLMMSKWMIAAAMLAALCGAGSTAMAQEQQPAPQDTPATLPALENAQRPTAEELIEMTRAHIAQQASTTWLALASQSLNQIHNLMGRRNHDAGVQTNEHQTRGNNRGDDGQDAAPPANDADEDANENEAEDGRDENGIEDQVTVLTATYEAALANAADAAQYTGTGREQALLQIQQATDRQQATLTAVYNGAPDAAKPHLEHAMQACQHGHEQATASIQRVHQNRAGGRRGGENDDNDDADETTGTTTATNSVGDLHPLNEHGRNRPSGSGRGHGRPEGTSQQTH
jgi:hypothetical protein